MKGNASIFLSFYNGVSVHVNDSVVTNCDCEQILSTTADSHVTFDKHIDILWHKSNIKQPVLSSIKLYLTKQMKRVLFNIFLTH